MFSLIDKDTAKQRALRLIREYCRVLISTKFKIIYLRNLCNLLGGIHSQIVYSLIRNWNLLSLRFIIIFTMGVRSKRLVVTFASRSILLILIAVLECGKLESIWMGRFGRVPFILVGIIRSFTVMRLCILVVSRPCRVWGKFLILIEFRLFINLFISKV